MVHKVLEPFKTFVLRVRTEEYSSWVAGTIYMGVNCTGIEVMRSHDNYRLECMNCIENLCHVTIISGLLSDLRRANRKIVYIRLKS